MASEPFTTAERLALPDGQTLVVRPMQPADLDALRRAIDSADPETIHRRFLGGRSPTNQAQLRRLVELDHHRREALGAFINGGQLVDITRYERDDATVEVAIAVDAQWRHLGLAQWRC